MDGEFFERLAARLEKLRHVDAGGVRDESWWTAKEIADWWTHEEGGTESPDEIDEALRDWWLVNQESSRIRPAKYPHRVALMRLWGHVKCVKAMPEGVLEIFQGDDPVELDDLGLAEGAPTWFLSFVSADENLALELRRRLGDLGVDSWLYKNRIKRGEDVARTVQRALLTCDRLVVIGTPLSLASAWVDSEVTSNLASGGTPMIAFDGKHADLMALLETWRPPSRADEWNFIRERLASLRAEYVSNCECEPTGDERIEKYEESARRFLFSMGVYDLSIFPRKPARWGGDECFCDFDRAVPQWLENHARTDT